MPSCHLTQSAAFLLFSSVSHPVRLHQELPPADILRSCEDVQAHSSASSLTSLPLTSLPSTSSLSLTSDPLSSQLSPEAMLAEIAQLSRQNELIKVQLSQAKGLGSGVGGSPNSSNGQRRWSSGSTGRVTPQSVGERRASVSSSTGRRSQHVQAAEGEQPTNQVRLSLSRWPPHMNVHSHASHVVNKVCHKMSYFSGAFKDSVPLFESLHKDFN